MARQSEARTDRGALVQSVGTATGAPSRSSDDIVNEPTADRPTTTFRYAPGGPVAGSPVLFEVENADSEFEYEWTFDDGSTATGQKASNIYDAAGETEVTLTVTDDDGETETVRETLTVYRAVEVELRESESADGLVPVVIRGDSDADFDPAADVAVESLRFGAPTAIAMGSGAAPVRSEARDGDLRVWVREDRTGLGDDDSARLAGRTTDGLPLVGNADGA